jgi:DNA repair exonuclease SbcCD nuclease subunit
VSETKPIRVLFLSDTHLGFDLPFKPRIERRRRGHDFFANLDLALKPAIDGDVDIVIHGGDLLYRSKVPPALVEMAMAPLVRVAEVGVPVFIVPGNHERSKIPLHLWGAHQNLRIFDVPRTFSVDLEGGTVALSGFPFHRNVRDNFKSLVESTKFSNTNADLRLLCIHEAVEGARVGPSNFTFRRGPDVIPGRMIPGDFAAVLSGHIHRSQMLTHDLNGRKMAAPVLYPGSIERTSFAERNEDKHYLLLEFEPDGSPKGKLNRIQFIKLPARPMVSIEVDPGKYLPEELKGFLKTEFSTLDPDAIVSLRILGEMTSETAPILRAPYLRELAPATMNVSLRIPQNRNRERTTSSEGNR